MRLTSSRSIEKSRTFYDWNNSNLHQKAHSLFQSTKVLPVDLKSLSKSKPPHKEGGKTDRVEDEVQSRLKFLKEINMVSPKINIWDEFTYPTTLDEVKMSLLHQNPASCDRINSLMVILKHIHRAILENDMIWLSNKTENKI